MPIKSLSETVRLPRLGKIHLGYKDPEKKGAPTKTDYFVFPKDHSDYQKLVQLYGEKPRELPILIPVEDEEAWASQYYKAYNQTYGLVCKGDGEIALRMIDTQTNQIPTADRLPKTVQLLELSCAGRNCPEYQAKKCHEVMNLRFILPEVPGLGVWQIDTGSKNSIININSCAGVIKRAFGRISMIPLKLTLEPIQVNNPQNGKRQTVYVLNLRSDVTLAQLADAAREQVKMLSVGTLEDAFDLELEKDIDELWGPKEQAIEIPKPIEIEPKAEPSPPAEPERTEETPETEEFTTEELFSRVAEAKGWKSAKTARSWLVNGPLKILEERIDNEPKAVWDEIKAML